MCGSCNVIIELLVYVLQRLDRAWYDNDGGYDETNNPFANIPEEYTKKKEEKLAKTAVKKMSAQQRQINKVRKKKKRVHVYAVIIMIDKSICTCTCTYNNYFVCCFIG